MSKDAVIQSLDIAKSPEPRRPNESGMTIHELAADQHAGVCPYFDPNMQKIMQVVKKVATTNACVLIVGETGTGKKTIGRVIHDLSARGGEATIVNVSEIDREHQVGHLLDAINDAAGSTVIIENIDRLTDTAQIQFNAIMKNQVTLPKPTRIIATTEADLANQIRSGAFFKELYYRLNVIRLEVPSLRQRKPDILPLAQHFVRKLGAGNQYRFTPQAEQTLARHSWSGNVQELRNVIKRALLLATSTEITAENLELGVNLNTDDHWVEHLPVGSTLKEVETKFILRTIEHHQGNRTHSAKTLGISLRTLRNKINEFQIDGIEVTEPTKGRALS